MRAAFAWFVLAVLIYLGSRTDAPTPDRTWEPYATSSATGKLEWVLAGPYTTYGECTFNAEKAVKDSAYYREPKGCLYKGYQNPYIQWIVNTAIGAGKFKCIARMKNREEYNAPLYEPVLGDYPSDHSEDWACYL